MPVVATEKEDGGGGQENATHVSWSAGGKDSIILIVEYIDSTITIIVLTYLCYEGIAGVQVGTDILILILI